MPYIKQERRKELEPLLNYMLELKPTVIEIGYILTLWAEKHVRPSYNNYKNYLGELRQCSTEIQRRMLAERRYIADRQNTVTTFEAYDMVDNQQNLLHIIQLMEVANIVVDGDLNYIIFTYVKKVFLPGPNTGDITKLLIEINNVCEWIEDEILAPYEDSKMKENGDC